jgi:hypothetical protein
MTMMLEYTSTMLALVATNEQSGQSAPSVSRGPSVPLPERRTKAKNRGVC